MLIPREYVEEVQNRSDVVDIIGSYVTLKRAGSNMNGLCPFHSEKTPSFTVFPSDNSFYCFGCGAGGSVITFIQKIENLEFADAVRFLADRVGVTIPDSQGYEPVVKTISRNRLFDMNRDAAKFFHETLYSPSGKEGLHYVKDVRMLSDATIKHFGLGFAPAEPWVFINYMQKKGYTNEELVQGFLARERVDQQGKPMGQFYSLFRNRLMFPIIDTTGHVIAFGGRVMDDSKPKYLNTSDTPGFNKRRNLYALNYAKNSESDSMILCEGYMDVIALHVAGFTNSVATLGTAITPDHARILTKYVKKCILMYDSDEAGQRADSKAMQILGEVGLEVRVLKLNGAKDPDEFLRKFGKERFNQEMNGTKSGFDYKLEKILANYNLSLPEQRVKAINEVCRMVAEYPTVVEREIYTQQAAKKVEMSPEVMAKSVQESLRRINRERINNQSQQAMQVLHHFQDHVTPEANQNIAAVSAEETIIGLLLLFDDYRAAVVKGTVKLNEADFVTQFGARAFKSIKELQENDKGFDFTLLGADFNESEMGRLTQCLQKRKQLNNNSSDVLVTAVQALKDAKQTKDKEEQKDVTSWLDAIRQKNKEKKTRDGE